MSDVSFADFLDQVGVPCTDGSFVSERAARIVEIIRDYDPALEVEWIPREHRLPGDNAVRIVDTRLSGLARVVMSFPDESHLDERVLERLFLADGTKHDVVARLEAQNAAARAVELKRELEVREEGKDLMLYALRSPRVRYSFTTKSGKKVVAE